MPPIGTEFGRGNSIGVFQRGSHRFPTLGIPHAGRAVIRSRHEALAVGTELGNHVRAVYDRLVQRLSGLSIPYADGATIRSGDNTLAVGTESGGRQKSPVPPGDF